MDDEIPIGHLQRRKIEGRVLLPFIQACRRRLGDDATRELLEEVIGELAAQDGARWADAYGGDMAGLKRMSEEVFAGGGSLELEELAASDDALDFDVTRCRYAEFWQEMGLADIGYQIHCRRDFAMIDGFNPDIELTRTQTRMEGASHCDFRFRKKRNG